MVSPSAALKYVALGIAALIAAFVLMMLGPIGWALALAVAAVYYVRRRRSGDEGAADVDTDADAGEGA